jgi:hypothetical protein
MTCSILSVNQRDAEQPAGSLFLHFSTARQSSLRRSSQRGPAGRPPSAAHPQLELDLLFAARRRRCGHGAKPAGRSSKIRPSR